jgi:hypothetical protein
MPVTVACPQLGDAALRTQLYDAVSTAVRRWRPSFELWKLSLFRSQSGSGWDLAITGPRFRKVFTLYGPADDLPGLVTAYVDAILRAAKGSKGRDLSPRREPDMRTT